MIIKSTGYIQVGNTRFPLDNWEITATTDVPSSSLISWSEQLYPLRLPMHVEGTYEPTTFTDELFRAIDIAQSITWHAVKPWRKHSKQTRAWYRVRARAHHRRKFVAHPRRRNGGRYRHAR